MDTKYTYRTRDGVADALNLQEGDPQPKTAAQQVADARKNSSSSGGLGVGVYAVVLVGAALAFFAYQQLQSSQNKS